ncbi:hypothetical protein ALI144C_11580 [Actinosynnema sp. ALI-1.44]|uniref:DUF4331 domain-containing protein n=1 Tax=Actinosynnema sp. ALI-1.44 TaxID=1933779 RepID=UPI00097CBE70|nr:DUF4331 domain-containing protein [Actinosynnema sp. ALI-1.44]ONI86530.1 hypothetical protein ALI144C_11580 [Actinosynnema sp. ALI-1.44]
MIALRKPLAMAGTLLIGVALAGFMPGSATASSHREAPLIAADPTVDNTDVYAFVSPDNPETVTVVANWFGLQEPNGGPNFYPWATDANYDINIDNDGDAKPDLTYRWTFENDDRRGKSTFLYNNGPVTSLDDENLLFRQNYKLEVIDDKGKDKTLIRKGRVAPSTVGPASMPDYRVLRDQAVAKLPGGGQTYVGAAEDSFFLDLRVFDGLYGGNLSEVGQDTLRGYNVNTIAIQVPKSVVSLKGDARRNPVIGVWSDTERRTMRLSPGQAKAEGPYVQVSRLGNPLVNEVVSSAALKDAFNGLTPDRDGTVKPLLDRVTNPEVAKLLEAAHKLKAPATPRDDLVEIFLTGITTKAGGPIKADLNSQLNNADVNPKKFVPSEMLRLNTSIAPTDKPNRLGLIGGDLQGFPNGRRLADDVVDIELQVLAGAAQTGQIVPELAAGDKVDANDRWFEQKFPYVALPANTAVNSNTAMVGFTPSANATDDMPVGPVLGGVAGALALVGGGFWMMRRRRRQA